MSKSIYPCLWFSNQASEAAKFYCSVFGDARITAENPLVVNFELFGQKIMALNGGAEFSFNPSLSLFVKCETREEIEALYQKLMDGGKAMMPLGNYPWSSCYAWIADKYGLSWQLMESQPATDRISPCLLFVNKSFGNGEAAIRFYTSLFSDTSVDHITLYGAGEPQPEGSLKHGEFKLNGTNMMAMDGTSEHAFNFNESISFVVECATQQEIDFFWNRLTADGGAESMCGWLVDRFGISWQIIPEQLGTLMKEPGRAQRVMDKLIRMKKLDLETLMNA